MFLTSKKKTITAMNRVAPIPSPFWPPSSNKQVFFGFIKLQRVLSQNISSRLLTHAIVDFISKPNDPFYRRTQPEWSNIRSEGLQFEQDHHT